MSQPAVNLPLPRVNLSYCGILNRMGSLKMDKFVCSLVACLSEIVVVSLILTSISSTVASATTVINPLNEMPKISIKMSTSIVESPLITDSPHAEFINHRSSQNGRLYQAESSSRQQRSPQITAAATTTSQQQDHNFIGIKSPKLQPIPVQFKSQDALGTHATPEQARHQHEWPSYQSLNGNGKILDHPGGYRWSTSTSWNLSPPLQAQQFQQRQSSTDQQKMAAPAGAQTDLGGSQGRSYAAATSAVNLPEMAKKCPERRSLGRVLGNAKNLLTGGFASLEQYVTPGNFMLSSSLLAAAIPLAAFILPDTRSNQRADLDDSAASFSSTSRFNTIQGRVDTVMGWIERSIEHLPNFPRLHPQECVKRSICEAHNDPNKYGAIGFMLRLFFPATNLSSTDRMDNMEYKVINKYRHAAGYGANKRIDNNGTSTSVCKEKYEDCLVSLLDVAQNLMGLFLK